MKIIFAIVFVFISIILLASKGDISGNDQKQNTEQVTIMRVDSKNHGLGLKDANQFD